ncbi:hypothetical protein [Oceanospirillum sediminis]|uniref:Uncharacterized protein n=1 Tax=Oceanospirillum sediminis TaxID=2760088 RepID=A0A839IXZ2_9GAMM|nr:hypothetical protein [Oceanospirillum sediminis]MBB1489309.1 hypothetical protein [Oceanospirillum sediminis]
MLWGLSGPEKVVSQRRTRTLGLSSVVRRFNDLAVPQLGSVRHVKTVFLACLGIGIAKEARKEGLNVSNIQVTNAIEALACFLAYESNGWQSDERLRGSTKLQGQKDLSYKAFSANNIYVTQPMRMSTVQALPGLGLVESTGERFNSFTLSQQGQDFIDAGCVDLSCDRLKIQKYLINWVLGEYKHKCLPVNRPGLIKALSPLVRLNDQALNIFKQALLSGAPDAVSRRRGVLDWVASAKPSEPDLWQNPGCIETEHFKDLQSGALFFLLRDKALDLLNVIEAEIGLLNPCQLDLNQVLSSDIKTVLTALKEAAEKFLSLEHDPIANKAATKFAQACASPSEQEVIRYLVARDNVVLRNRGDLIVPAQAFGKPDSVESDDEEVHKRLFPSGISFRVWNMYVLNLDFENRLDTWLDKEEAPDE